MKYSDLDGVREMPPSGPGPRMGVTLRNPYTPNTDDREWYVIVVSEAQRIYLDLARCDSYFPTYREAVARWRELGGDGEPTVIDATYDQWAAWGPETLHPNG